MNDLELHYKNKIEALGYKVKTEWKPFYGTGYAYLLSVIVNGRAMRSSKGYQDLYNSIIKRLEKEEQQ